MTISAVLFIIALLMLFFAHVFFTIWTYYDAGCSCITPTWAVLVFLVPVLGIVFYLLFRASFSDCFPENERGEFTDTAGYPVLNGTADGKRRKVSLLRSVHGQSGFSLLGIVFLTLAIVIAVTAVLLI